LTYRRRNSLHSVSAATINVVVENFISAPSFSSFIKKLRFFDDLGTGDAESRVLRLVRDLVLLRIMQASQRFLKL
jgi:hypothetical protein